MTLKHNMENVIAYLFEMWDLHNLEQFSVPCPNDTIYSICVWEISYNIMCLSYQHVIYNLDSSQIIRLYYVLQFI